MDIYERKLMLVDDNQELLEMIADIDIAVIKI